MLLTDASEKSSISKTLKLAGTSWCYRQVTIYEVPLYTMSPDWNADIVVDVSCHIKTCISIWIYHISLKYTTLLVYINKCISFNLDSWKIQNLHWSFKNDLYTNVKDLIKDLMCIPNQFECLLTLFPIDKAQVKLDSLRHDISCIYLTWFLTILCQSHDIMSTWTHYTIV